MKLRTESPVPDAAVALYEAAPEKGASPLFGLVPFSTSRCRYLA
jgi:hypothetical protein